MPRLPQEIDHKENLLLQAHRKNSICVWYLIRVIQIFVLHVAFHITWDSVLCSTGFSLPSKLFDGLLDPSLTIPVQW